MSPNRYGDLEPDAAAEASDEWREVEVPHKCDKGWLDYLNVDHPVPCPRCKPHLARSERLRKMGLGDKK